IRELPSLGIECAYFYAFSIENWLRSSEEVSFLMKIAERMLEQDLEEFASYGARVRMIGDLSRVSPEIRELAKKAEERTKDNKKITIVFCFSYGGRDEIVAAAKKFAEDKDRDPLAGTNDFGKYLLTAGLPDPDLIIRTSGEQRLSGFLLWQAAYAELFFVDTFWPDFTKSYLEKIIEEYKARERRFGK
ncbi:MAG: polyprenyl diphosphate synthase, partial [Patescibacteria group bacterium]